MQKIGNELGRKAAAWLATCFVVVGGLATCIVLSVLFFEKPLVPLAWIGGVTGGVALLFWLLRDRKEDAGSLSLMAWVLRGRDSTHAKVVVRVSKKRDEAPVEYGTNLPPSVDAIRQAANDSKTWVPSKPPHNQKRLGRVRLFV